MAEDFQLQIRHWLVHNPDKVKILSQQVSYPSVVSAFPVDEKAPYFAAYDVFDMGQIHIVQNKEGILYTKGIRDCIGISVCDPSSKTAALYHASMLEFPLEPQRKNNCLFKQYFDVLRGLIKDPSYTVVNLVSSYWSQNVLTAISLLRENSFPIAGVDIPDARLSPLKLLAIYILIKDRSLTNT